MAKRKLRENKRIILISTQLIEAGVDIDFPVLYRDFTTVSSIIQSAGRCNRNGKLSSLGKIELFVLQKNGKIRSSIIYQGKYNDILTFTKQSFKETEYDEKDLLQVQCAFFDRILSDLNYAKHSQNSPNVDFDFLKDIQECKYEKIGKFKLIDKQIFGEEIQYYIPSRCNDLKFDSLLNLQQELMSETDINAIKAKKKGIEILLKKMSNQIIQIRLKKDQIKPPCCNNDFNLHQMDRNYYSFEEGVDLQGGEFIL